MLDLITMITIIAIADAVLQGLWLFSSILLIT